MSTSASSATDLPIRTQPICLRGQDQWDRIAIEVGLYDEIDTATEEQKLTQLEVWWSNTQRRPVIVEGTTRCDELKSHWTSLGFKLQTVIPVNGSANKAYFDAWTTVANKLKKRNLRLRKKAVKRLLGEYGKKGPADSSQWSEALSLLS